MGSICLETSLIKVSNTYNDQAHWVIFLTILVANFKDASSKDCDLVLLSSKDIEF